MSALLRDVRDALRPKKRKSLIPPSGRKFLGTNRTLSPLPGQKERLELAAAVGVGTLPERIVRAWLMQSGLPYFEQQIEFGGHLRIGGGVVDFIVNIGAPPGVVIRVQGDYWHSLPERRGKDWVQYERLVAKGYRVFDAWEHDITEAVLGGFLGSYMMENLYGG